MQQIFFEDYQEGASRETTGRTITETDIVMHAGQTGDFFPHHMDAEWCKTQPFGQRMAHGTLVFSIAIGLTATVINEVAFSYGYDRLRFLKPVFIGDTIRSKVTIKGKRPYKRPGAGLVTELVEVYNQRGECVMACEHILLAQLKQEK
ncbi:MaoC/PaaZ C-terminal domain-containing protein [Chitinophaga alhagiae]|uniref:MaoC/PaaZ C-terminal domain-containing protein n=1 Tax=Chitinophaga alhagiae TaxID=2203219 RepID=UPI000E5C3666|nr:MaoC/PaaZ C-terminal domain-containing protein [Chitinophaga alhagiae]